MWGKTLLTRDDLLLPLVIVNWASDCTLTMNHKENNKQHSKNLLTNYNL